MRKYGFTLAEVLITLTVIGIVAAISIPALMQNVNERTWNAKRKALHSRMAAAIGQIEDINKFGKFETVTVTNNDNTTSTEQIDTVAESFVIDGLSKVYKITNVCGSTNLDKCGLSTTYTNLNGDAKTLPVDISSFNGASSFKKTKPASFQTANGESLIVYYNPDCRPLYITETTRYPKETICANFIYDLNGADEPNEMGKDMGVMGVIYDTSQEPEVVAPNIYYKYAGQAPSYAEDGNDAASKCKKEDPKLRLPSLNELIIANFNYRYVSEDVGGVPGTIITPGKSGTTWAVHGGNATVIPRTQSDNVTCVKD